MNRGMLARPLTPSWLYGVSLLALAASAVPAKSEEALPPIEIGADAAPRSDRAKAADAPFRAARPGDALSGPAADNAPTPKSSVTMEGIKILGGPAQASSYKVLDMMPSVIEDSADPYGLSFNRSITVRGVSDFFLARTINGLPIQGIVGGADLFDLDDIGRVDLYRGSIPANQGFGFSNAAGVLDLNLLPPKEKLSGTISQGAGSNGFHRTFARIDSGRLPTGTSFFVSGSITDAEKWKGDGDARRKNVAFGLTQPLGDQLEVSVYGVHNDQKANAYLPLTFVQTQNLAATAFFDYNTAFTGKSGIDASYYAFNRTRYVTNAIFAEIAYRIDPTQSIVLKPYYWRNTGYQETTSGASVRLWPISNYNLGGTIEYKKHLPWDADFALGFWSQSAEPEPPPLHQKLYTVTPIGSLNFSSWSSLATSGTHQFFSPYTQYTQTFDATTVSGGVRLHIESTPHLQYFNAKGLPDVTYSDVWSYLPTPDTNGVAPAVTYSEWLPNLGVRHRLSEEWSANASYSRKVARPDWGPQASSFLGAEAAYLAKGITLASLMGRIRPATVDAVDVGLRYETGDLTIAPTFFGFWTHKKEVLVYDPAVGQNYYQSNAATVGRGFELETSWKATDWLTLTGSATIASETYVVNIQAGSSSVMQIGGKQTPYTPRYQAKLAATYHRDGFEITPVVRFNSTRYGLADNSQAVSPYAIVDVNASYEFGTKLGLTPMTVSAGVTNLFDHRYISAISVNETNLSSTSYYVGAPRTIFAGVTASF
ncbi:TonB-dependent receptor [Methylosinus sp. LW3]|uniref:TonB-dependent receptor n=1 Tax=Methylosinus sp. LW3 TaxID=107635 RepID=UPI0004B66D69|nr:TonB-dependent receptor [Methylosinus sp. LW3]